MDARIIYETRRLIKKNLLGRALAEIEQLRDFMTYAPLFERVSKIQNDYIEQQSQGEMYNSIGGGSGTGAGAGAGGGMPY